MNELKVNFEQWIINDFKMFLKDVPLASLKSYVKREALPGAKRMVTYYEDHLQKEQKRGIDVTGYNFITEKIHLYERYADFLEEVLQNPDMINLSDPNQEEKSSLITDKPKFEKIISNVLDAYTIDGKWYNTRDYHLFIHLLEAEFNCTGNRKRKALHESFRDFYKWRNIGEYSYIGKTIKDYWTYDFNVQSQKEERDNEVERMIKIAMKP